MPVIKQILLLEENLSWLWARSRRNVMPRMRHKFWCEQMNIEWKLVYEREAYRWSIYVNIFCAHFLFKMILLLRFSSNWWLSSLWFVVFPSYFPRRQKGIIGISFSKTFQWKLCIMKLLFNTLAFRFSELSRVHVLCDSSLFVSIGFQLV